MKTRYRYWTVLLIIFLLTSCTKSNLTPCREILGALVDAEVDLPAGKIYDMRAAEGEDEYLSESLIFALLGNGAMPTVYDSWIDCALFLSLGSHPCEFAVFLCDSHDTAQDTARLFCSRIDAVKTLKGGGEYAHILDGARVCIIKNYVVLLISSDGDTAEKKARQAIG